MRIDILTIFPEMFDSVFGSSIIKRGVESGKVEIFVHDIRNSTVDAHRTVDDAPYGGGAGMVMKVDVLDRALSTVPKVGNKSIVLLMSAQGERFEHNTSVDLLNYDQLIMVCGRYEGVDERFIELCVDREISIGDYVLSGGEIAAMVVCDSVIRLIPNVLGNSDSLKSESFSNGLLEYPQYTRPAEYKGLKVPDVLQGGNHKEIEKWKSERSLERTKNRRPDLLKKESKI